MKKIVWICMFFFLASCGNNTPETPSASWNVVPQQTKQTQEKSKEEQPVKLEVIDADKVTWKSVYEKDERNVFLNGNLIQNADVKTFEILFCDELWNDCYAKDKNKVYLNQWGVMTEVVDADARSFEQIKNFHYYTEDKNSIFYRGVKLSADKKSFEIFSQDVAKDNSFVFVAWQPIKEFDANTFESVSQDVYKDKNFTYKISQWNIEVVTQ